VELKQKVEALEIARTRKQLATLLRELDAPEENLQSIIRRASEEKQTPLALNT